MLRTLAEACLGGVTVKRSLPAPFQPAAVWASGRSGGLKFLLKPSGSIDPLLLKNARRIVRPGNVVWDIGANIGWFSAAAARLAGDKGAVFSVEADIEVARLLQRSAESLDGRCARVRVLPAAISEESGVCQFNIARRSRAANSLMTAASSQTGGIAHTRTVAAMTLDDLQAHLPAPHVLKIDVEEAEAMVLRGARNLLSRVRPVVLCEVGRLHRQEVEAEFAAARYALFDAGRLDTIQPAQHAAWDCLAVPQERAHEFNPA